MNYLVCKCCGQKARWCGDGDPDWTEEDDENSSKLAPHTCDHIQCDHCGMQYSLESEASKNAETIEDAKKIMYKVYNGIK